MRIEVNTTEPVMAEILDELTRDQLRLEMSLVEAEILQIEDDLEEIQEKRRWIAACSRRLELKAA
jgi:hypothetical protein